MRRTAILLASMALALLLVSGVALAINTVQCKSGTTCNGTPKSDRLLGTSGKNIMYGRDSGDILKGFGLHDGLEGQRGNDKLFGGSGLDLLGGGLGNDALNGGADRDGYAFFAPGWGHDTITDTTNNNTIEASYGTSSLIINLDSDPASSEVRNASGTSTVNWAGNVIARVVNTNDGNDRISGNVAANFITSQWGTDVISAGPGNDQINVTDGTGGDRVDCGEDAPGVTDNDKVYLDSGDTALDCETEIRDAPQ